MQSIILEHGIGKFEGSNLNRVYKQEKSLFFSNLVFYEQLKLVGNNNSAFNFYQYNLEVIYTT